MGEEFHEGKGQVVHWWQHVRYGEENKRLKGLWNLDEAQTDHDRALGVRVLGSGQEGFLQGIVALVICSELDINVDGVTVA